MGSYVLLLFLLDYRWKRFSHRPSGIAGDRNFSLVVPFRDELGHLPRLLDEIREKALEGEVILVDDESTDGSFEWCTAYINRNKLAKWKCIKSRGEGKKAALHTGISSSRGGIIVTTDADVVFPPEWPRILLASFDKASVKLVAGPVISIEGRGLFGAFEQIEWASILLVTGASFDLQKPLMCSGANMAFRKDAFFEVGGYKGNEHHLSGDDEFLLKKIYTRYGKEAAVYQKGADALVRTFAWNDPMAWINQRARWASKWRLHRSHSHAFSAAILFLYSVFHLGTAVLLFEGPFLLLFFLLYWIGKTGGEKRVLGRILAYYGIKQKTGNYVAAGFIQPVMVILAGILAIFGKFKWKGRKNKSKH
ncbi:glycosyltransferase [Negadavirga shengliensis]|uniref:Glycosyltransferase n=1 Tax=Negadavirga shengliensis TaxID=1389218 RepID=A0ABV9T2U4_9BACT